MLIENASPVLKLASTTPSICAPQGETLRLATPSSMTGKKEAHRNKVAQTFLSAQILADAQTGMSAPPLNLGGFTGENGGKNIFYFFD